MIRQNVPLWVDEGLSDYMAGVWRPLDIMQVRDVAVTDTVPSMTQFEGSGGFASGRVVYNLGHAVFEFMEDRWGKEGIRQFMLALRRASIGGGSDVYDEAFNLSGEEFDDASRSISMTASRRSATRNARRTTDATWRPIRSEAATRSSSRSRHRHPAR